MAWRTRASSAAAGNGFSSRSMSSLKAPYASIRIAVWNVRDGNTSGPYRGLIDNQGWCVLSSTLPARDLESGGSHDNWWCRSTSLGSGPVTRGTGPWLGLAGISPS
jgi:hypothetical protein